MSNFERLSSDRVEELESRVSELQAAVDGLTEELVEVKARLRDLEDEEGVEIERSGATTRDSGDDAADAATAPTDGVDDEESQSGDVNTEESGEGSNDGGSEESDIIVA